VQFICEAVVKFKACASGIMPEICRANAQRFSPEPRQIP
jgi:hypothetical protein